MAAPPRAVAVSMLSFLLLIQLTAASTSDMDTLLRIKSYVVDPLNMLESWIPSKSQSAPCSWVGITCDPRFENLTTGEADPAHASLVVAIDLSSKNLSGILSSEIGFMSSLQSLNLAHNNFSGPIPGSITSCTSLKYLNLTDNSFSDEVPAGLFTKLQGLETVDLWINALTGPVPKSVGLSPRLQHLDLGGNYLEGTIPDELGNISTLRYLTLAGNSLGGEIPKSLFRLPKLEWVYLGYNQLSGTIPEEVGLLRNSMVHLDLVFNQLTGSIPESIGNLSKLQYLFLYTNHLSGPIPDSIATGLPSLVSLDLSNNTLEGSIPPSIGSLRKLEVLNLFANSLTGTIPDEIATLPSLTTLALWQNQLTGTVPSGLGTSANLTTVDLSTNLLSGQVPASICAGGALSKLILFRNSFSGPIPDELGHCRSLKRVRIQNNAFSGRIPPSFASFEELYYLDLSSNQLSGDISDMQWTGSMLQMLYLSSNLLTGSIPASIFRLPSLVELKLSENRLTGGLTEEIGQAKLLTELDASKNLISGRIPPQIADCSKLVSINLATNRLDGAIPDSLGRMPSLGSLDLSNNQLTGGIPRSIASLESIELFNVAANRLSGPVPFYGSLAAVLNASSIEGNKALCAVEDSAELGIPRCPERGTMGIGWLVWIALSIAVGIALVYSTVVFFRRGFQIHEHRGKDGAWSAVLFHGLRVRAEDIEAASIESAAAPFECIDRNGKRFSVKRIHRNAGESVPIERFKAASRLRHDNVATIFGICSSRWVDFVLFEHAPGGALADCLSNIGWDARYRIVLGVAKGLAFLHGRRRKILHGCFSPEFVFLDLKQTPKVLIAVQGGDSDPAPYAAPELGYTKIVTEKTDVYAFGVMVLELVTGKRASESVFWKSGSTTIEEFIATEVLDPRLGGLSPQQDAEMMRVLRVGLACTNASSAERPFMAGAVEMLDNARLSLPRSIQMVQMV